jgi:hypothetical protein
MKILPKGGLAEAPAHILHAASPTVSLLTFSLLLSHPRADATYPHSPTSLSPTPARCGETGVGHAEATGGARAKKDSAGIERAAATWPAGGQHRAPRPDGVGRREDGGYRSAR